MAWNNKIEMAINLISEIALDNGISEEDSENLCSSLDALKKYVDATNFVGMDSDERDANAVCILNDAVFLCAPILLKLKESLSPAPPVKMKRSEALEMLKEEYSKAMESGDDEFLGTNINDWIEQKGIELVDDEEGDEILNQ